MDFSAGSLPEMVPYIDSIHRSYAESSTHQGSLHMLIQHLRAQLPLSMSHAELIWCMMEEYRPDLIEEMPHSKSLRCLCWENVLEYMYLVRIFFEASMVEKGSRL